MTRLVSVRQLMERTKANHEFVRREQADGQPIYEVTQLLNSFLGAFAYPWEHWKKELGKIPLEEAHGQGWPRVNASDPRDEVPRNLGDLLRLIRNALMHGNVRFLGNDRDEIYALELWNQHGKYRTWGATLDLTTLQRFLERFEEMAAILPDREPRDVPNHHIRDRPKPPICECCGK